MFTGSSSAAMSSVMIDGCSSPNTTGAALLPTVSQRSGSMARTKAPAITRPRPTTAASVTTTCSGDDTAMARKSEALLAAREPRSSSDIASTSRGV